MGKFVWDFYIFAGVENAKILAAPQNNRPAPRKSEIASVRGRHDTITTVSIP